MKALCRIGLAIAWLTGIAQAAKATNDDFIKSFLHDNFDHQNFGMVIGIVDVTGTRVFCAGKLDNGSDQEVNEDTQFGIASVTKTFTTLLLQDMVERGEMRLGDPVAKYLPGTVQVPTYQGKEITLQQLATHTSGLPPKPDNATTIDSNPYVDYTAEKLFSFLSGYRLTREPGATYEYSDLGIGLLAHAISCKAGSDYETLVIDRICRPLSMDSTCISVSQELKPHLAIGHWKSHKTDPDFAFGVMNGAGALRSTTSDMLKYVSANLGITSSPLTPLMVKTHQIQSDDPQNNRVAAMDWRTHGTSAADRELLGHPGGTVGYRSFVGFDLKQRRGVVVLSNQSDGFGRLVEPIGWLVLQNAPLTPQLVASLIAADKGELAGIGAKLEFDSLGHQLKIVQVVPNSPAAQAGLLAGNVIEKIDDVSAADRTIEECVCFLRGQPGSTVRLVVVDPTDQKARTVELVRKKLGT